MKRILSLIIIFCILFSVSGCGGDTGETGAAVAATADEKEDTFAYRNEIQRAMEYGFLSEEMPKDLKETIRFSDFTALIDRLLSVYHGEPSVQWQQLQDNSSVMDKDLTRMDGALILYYGAQEIGLDEERSFRFDKPLTWEAAVIAVDRKYGNAGAEDEKNQFLEAPY